MPTNVLLIEDVEDLGRSGDLVSVKPGYARNFLFPKGKAIFADKRALAKQARLLEERKQRAAQERKEAEEFAKKIDGLSLTKQVKVDPEGHMYGSVSVVDVVALFDQKDIKIEKKMIQMKHPIKTMGDTELEIKLHDDISAKIKLSIIAEKEEPSE